MGENGGIVQLRKNKMFLLMLLKGDKFRTVVAHSGLLLAALITPQLRVNWFKSNRLVTP